MTEPRARILIVEDEAEIRRFVRLSLEAEGHEVHEADGVKRGLIEAGTRRPDLVVLDLGLPDGDGVDLIRDLRQWSAVPVIVLSARGGESDKISALDAGADDYLVKPFVFTELLARIQAVLRRGAAGAHHEPDRMALGDLELDTIRRRAFRAGTRLDLTAQEYTLLSVLLRHRGEVMSRTVLTELVWDMNFDGDSNVVEVAIRRLRSKLDEPFPSKLLHTVRGMGYVLELDRGEEPDAR